MPCNEPKKSLQKCWEGPRPFLWIDHFESRRLQRDRGCLLSRYPSNKQNNFVRKIRESYVVQFLPLIWRFFCPLITHSRRLWDRGLNPKLHQTWLSKGPQVTYCSWLFADLQILVPFPRLLSLCYHYMYILMLSDMSQLFLKCECSTDILWYMLHMYE